jgi:hypothetical protein
VRTGAATLEASAGAVVVVVVVVVAVGALDCRAATRASSVELVVGDSDGAIGGVTVLGARPGSVVAVVVVVAVGGGAVALLLG